MIAGMLLQFTVVLVWHFSAPSLGSKNVNDRMLLQLINPCLSMNIAGTFSAPSLGLKKHDILIAGTFQHPSSSLLVSGLFIMCSAGT